MKVSLLLAGVLLLLFIPVSTRAGFLSFVGDIFRGDKEESMGVEYNSQTIQLLEASLVLDPGASHGGAEIVIIEKVALLSETGPLGTLADLEESAYSSDQISLHVVREGETLSDIAKMYGVRVETIMWANEIDTKGTIREGETLLILPINGIQHTVKKGETLLGIAKKTGADVKEIARYNGLLVDSVLAVGTEILIPDGEGLTKSSSRKKSRRSLVKGRSGDSVRASAPNGYYARPVRGRKTQGFHGPYQAVDIGAPRGTTIVASASGTVITVKSPKRWNGGYGGLVILKHDNNTQTLYAHNNKNVVVLGQRVEKGQKIAEVGSTGRSTGPHLHFEVRGIGKPIKTPILY